MSAIVAGQTDLKGGNMRFRLTFAAPVNGITQIESDAKSHPAFFARMIKLFGSRAVRNATRLEQLREDGRVISCFEYNKEKNKA